jgi:hypothetical protein
VNDPIANFANLAERYCAWAAGGPGTPAADEEQAREFLPSLYLAAHRLPEGAPGNTEPRETTQSEWQVVYNRFGNLTVGYYGDTLDPLVLPPEEAGVSDLADDLADIHLDLMRGLALFRAGEPEAAAWHWRYHFIMHWGSHLVGAMRALHHSWAKVTPFY